MNPVAVLVLILQCQGHTATCGVGQYCLDALHQHRYLIHLGDLDPALAGMDAAGAGRGRPEERHEVDQRFGALDLRAACCRMGLGDGRGRAQHGHEQVVAGERIAPLPQIGAVHGGKEIGIQLESIDFERGAHLDPLKQEEGAGHT